MKLENEQIILKFLFGEMSEDERFEFEEKFILDAKLFEEVKVVEDELIEKYVRGWLTSAETSKFEKHFLNTEKRRERVEFSRQMIAQLKAFEEKPVLIEKKEIISTEESFWNKLFGAFLAPKTVMAGAFAILVVAFGSWFLYQNFRNTGTQIVKKENTETQPLPINTSTPTPEDSPEELPENTSVNEGQESQSNSQVNTSNETNKPKTNTKQIPRKTPKPKKSPRQIKKKAAPIKTPQVQRTAPNPVLALFAGTVRSGGKNNVLNLPKNAKGATLQLNLEANDYKSYQAQLTDADGNILFQRGNLKARKSRINFFIPAKNLKRGDYIIRLFGKNDSGENESVADFQFRVQR